MSYAETHLFKGAQLYERIRTQSALLEDTPQPPSKLVLSFDLYCLLLEYAALVERLNSSEGATVADFWAYDELLFDTGSHQLALCVDFFAPPESVTIF